MARGRRRRRGRARVRRPVGDRASRRRVPIARFAQAAETGVGLSTLFNVAMSNDRFALLPGFIDGPSGDLRLRADPAATVPLAAMPGWAWAPVDQYTQDGEPFAACPRGFARRMVDALADRGLSVRAAFEFEFSVGRHRDDGGFEPAHEGPGLQRHRARRQPRVRARPHHDDARRRACDLQQFHPEYADGQFEMSIAPREPGRAPPTPPWSCARPCARSPHGTGGAPRSRRRSRPTPATARTCTSACGSGDRNLMSGGDGPAGMQERGEAFVAGILHELPALVAVAAPTCVELPPPAAAPLGGRDAVLGHREPRGGAPVRRRPTPRPPAAANVEVKPVDGTANPYLAVGAMLAAGLHGLDAGDRLPPSTEEDPTRLPEDVREERGVRQLPASLSEAAEQLAASHGAPRGDGGVPVRDVPRDPARRGRAVRRARRRRADPPHSVAVLTRRTSSARSRRRDDHDPSGSDRRRRRRRALPSVPDARICSTAIRARSRPGACSWAPRCSRRTTRTTSSPRSSRSSPRRRCSVSRCGGGSPATWGASRRRRRSSPLATPRCGPIPRRTCVACSTSERVVAVVADEGYPQPTIPAQDFEEALGGVPVHRVGRIEPWIVDAREEGTFDGTVQRFEDAVNAGGNDPRLIGYKTIIAYRTGLDITDPSSSEAAAAYDRWRADDWRETREHAKPVRDFLLRRAFALAKEHDRVFHVHVGGGRSRREPDARDAAGRVLVLRRAPGHPDRDDPLGMAVGRRGDLRRHRSCPTSTWTCPSWCRGDGARSTGRSR